MITPRSTMWLGLALAVVVAVTSCAPSTSATPGASGQGATTPAKGGSVTIGVPLDPVTLNPMKDGGYESNYTMSQVRERLVVLDAKGAFAPGLAASWSQPDPLTYVFKIRQNAKFSDGRLVTVDDIQYTYDQLTSTYVHAGDLKAFIKSTEIVDPSTFKVTMKSPWPDFIDDMANNSTQGIFPKGAVESCGTTCETNVIGAGPFMVKEWVKGDHLTLARNPNYWDSQLPYLDQVTYKVIPEDSVQVINLKTGSVDILLGLPYNQVADLKKESAVKIYTHGSGGEWVLLFNTLVPPFNDTKVRQAMQYALNRKEIVDTVFFGFAEVPTDMLPSWHWGHDATASAPEYNADKAKQMLADAGYGVAKPLTFEIKTINTPSAFADSVTIMQAQLAKIGVSIKVTPMAKSAFLAPLFRNPGSDPKSWQAGFEKYSFTTSTQSFVWEQYSANSYINSSNVNLAGGFQDPDLAKLVEAAPLETDQAKAKELFKQEWARLKQDSLSLYIAFTATVQAARSSVAGFDALTGNQYPLKFVSIQK